MSTESKFTGPPLPIEAQVGTRNTGTGQTNYLADYWRDQHDEIYALLMRYASRSGAAQAGIDSALQTLTSIINMANSELDMRGPIGDFAQTAMQRLSAILRELEVG